MRSHDILVHVVVRCELRTRERKHNPTHCNNKGQFLLAYEIPRVHDCEGRLPPKANLHSLSRHVIRHETVILLLVWEAIPGLEFGFWCARAEERRSPSPRCRITSYSDNVLQRRDWWRRKANGTHWTDVCWIPDGDTRSMKSLNENFEDITTAWKGFGSGEGGMPRT